MKCWIVISVIFAGCIMQKEHNSCKASINYNCDWISELEVKSEHRIAIRQKERQQF